MGRAPGETIGRLTIYQLKTAIGELYSAFSGNARPDRMMTDGGVLTVGESPLLTKQLRDLHGDEIGYYAAKAMTTWGSIEDYRYFMPRILELCTQPEQQAQWVNLEIILGKLDYGKWRTWPSTEQRAIESFLNAWWKKTVHTYADANHAPTIIRSIAGVADIDSEIAILHRAARETIAGRRALAALVCENWRAYEAMLKGKQPWRNAVWWDAVPGRYLKLLDYLFSEDAESCLQLPFISDDLEADSTNETRFVRDHIEWYHTVRSAVLAYVRQSERQVH